MDSLSELTESDTADGDGDAGSDGNDDACEDGVNSRVLFNCVWWLHSPHPLRVSVEENSHKGQNQC